MQLSFVFVLLLAFVSSSIAAPVATSVNRDTALLPRGRIREQLGGIRGDVEDIRCSEKSASKCYILETKYHRRIIKSDVSQAFDEWKLDIKYDWDLLRNQLRTEVSKFETVYTLFKEDIEKALTDEDSELVDWDLRFHLAYFWERLTHLNKDIRYEVYLELVKLTFALHNGLGVPYIPYPAGCSAILLQIETFQKYLSGVIDVPQYGRQLVAIHKKISEGITIVEECDDGICNLS